MHRDNNLFIVIAKVFSRIDETSTLINLWFWLIEILMWNNEKWTPARNEWLIPEL